MPELRSGDTCVPKQLSGLHELRPLEVRLIPASRVLCSPFHMSIYVSERHCHTECLSFFMGCREGRHVKSSSICHRLRIFIELTFQRSGAVHSGGFAEISVWVGTCVGESSEQRTGLFRSLGEEWFSPQVEQGPHDETGPFADQHQQGR